MKRLSTAIPHFLLRTFFLLALYDILGGIEGGLSLPAQSEGASSYRLIGDRLVVDQAVHWQSWTHPKHSVEIDSQNHTVRPRFIRKEINAIADLDHFQIKIGDQGEYDKLLRTLQRDDQLIPLNIRTGPATIAGFPLIYQKDNASKGFKKGDPVPWYFYHGGANDSEKLIKVVFDTQVVFYGTEFRSWIFDSRSNGVKQLIALGDADPDSPGDGLSVRTEFKEGLLADLAVLPNPFTPNGDGINDRVRFAFQLHGVTAPRVLSVQIYDMAGQLIRDLGVREVVRVVFETEADAPVWDGLNGRGQNVPPGILCTRWS